MTILTAPPCFDGYRPIALSPSLFSLLLSSVPERHKGSLRLALLRLECFLQVTDQSLRVEDLQGTSRSPPLELFMGACYAGALGTGSIPQRTCYFVKVALKSALPDLLLPEHTTKAAFLNEQLTALRQEFLDTRLNSERVQFWRGWHGQNAAGRNSNLRLWQFYEKYGQEATAELTDAALTWWRGKRNHGIPLIQELADFACDENVSVDFKDPISLGRFLGRFFNAWLTQRGEQENDIPASLVTWGRLVELLDSHLFGAAWAHPLPEIPRPRSISTRGTDLRVKATDDGLLVKESLLTPVPLEISDDQASQLLFKDIKRDHDVIVRWANAEVRLANNRLATRKSLAELGTPYRYRALLPTREDRLERASGEYLKHACATFEAEGLAHIGNYTATMVRYPRPYAATAWELGLPLPALLLAYGTILVDEHPELTPALLTDFNLYNSKGKKTGIQEIDGAWIMSGFKRRRGSRLAQQKIKLSNRAREIVESIEKLTEPLREWLRLRKKSHWRRLFLSIPSMGGTPKPWSPNSEAHRQAAWLASRFAELAGVEIGYATSLAKRFSLRSLRASRGVLIYIDTCSLEAMAKALGHHQFRQNLLDHYLPKPIQDFFTERWIRLFQTGIVCEALKNSDHLLDGAGFNSMEELDAFLEHHMLRKIPRHLEANDDPRDGVPGSQFVFGLSEQNLTVLRSLELAVSYSPHEAGASATRWARISERLFQHLETQTEQPDLRAMANQALLGASPLLVGGLVSA